MSISIVDRLFTISLVDMGSKPYEVIVVGGGPIGSVLSRRLAQHGLQVLLVERRSSFNPPFRCTGLISPRCLKLSGLGKEVVLREIRGGYIYAPNGYSIQVESSTPKLYVIDRPRFDKLLIERAADTGVDVWLGCKVVKLEDNQVWVARHGSYTTVTGRLIVGADGTNSKVASCAGFPPIHNVLIGLQTVVPYRPKRDDFVEIFLGRSIAPNFFAWIVPAEDGVARVGLATDRIAAGYRYLMNFLKTRNLQPQNVRSGLIPIEPRRRFVRGNVLLIGDAAGQVKPTSGGGIYPGLMATKLATKVIVRYISEGLPERYLTTYERWWRLTIGSELKRGSLLRKALNRLDDNILNHIFKLLDHPHILRLIADYGDADYPSRVVLKLLQDPAVWLQSLHFR